MLDIEYPLSRMLMHMLIGFIGGTIFLTSAYAVDPAPGALPAPVVASVP
jgi:hypothetical protein